MCVVSNIGDTYGDGSGWPWQPEQPKLPPPNVPQPFQNDWRKFVEDKMRDGVIESLKQRVAALEELLRKGKEFDAASGQPDCELDEKKEAMRKLAKELGVEINFP